MMGMKKNHPMTATEAQILITDGESRMGKRILDLEEKLNEGEAKRAADIRAFEATIARVADLEEKLNESTMQLNHHRAYSETMKEERDAWRKSYQNVTERRDHAEDRNADLEGKLWRMTADRDKAQGLLIVSRENVEWNKVHRELQEKALSKMTEERNRWRDLKETRERERDVWRDKCENLTERKDEQGR